MLTTLCIDLLLEIGSKIDDFVEEAVDMVQFWKY